MCLKKETNKDSEAIYLFNKNNLCPVIVEQSKQKFQQFKPTRTRRNNHLGLQFQSPPWTQSARLYSLIKRIRELCINNTAFIMQKCLEWLHPTPQSASVVIIIKWYIVTEPGKTWPSWVCPSSILNYMRLTVHIAYVPKEFSSSDCMYLNIGNIVSIPDWHKEAICKSHHKLQQDTQLESPVRFSWYKTRFQSISYWSAEQSILVKVKMHTKRMMLYGEHKRIQMLAKLTKFWTSSFPR